jgi:hypothetical protein
MHIEGKDDFHVRTEVFYMMKYDHVYGILTIKKDRLVFEPSLDSDWNDHLVKNKKDSARDLKQYETVIDFLDIIEANKMNLVNEKAVVSDNAYIREAYKFEIFL